MKNFELDAAKIAKIKTPRILAAESERGGKGAPPLIFYGFLTEEEAGMLVAAGGYMFILFWGRGCPLLALNTCDFRRAAAAAPPFFIIGGGTPRGTEAADLLVGGLGPDQT